MRAFLRLKVSIILAATIVSFSFVLLELDALLGAVAVLVVLAEVFCGNNFFRSSDVNIVLPFHYLQKASEEDRLVFEVNIAYNARFVFLIRCNFCGSIIFPVG